MKKIGIMFLFIGYMFLTGLADDKSSLANKGIIETVVLMFIGGFLTAFTPCVYPLIPVTIGIITGINKNGKGSPFLISLVYASGIILTYTTLGIFAGLGSFTFGNYMGNTLFVWIISLIFFALGLAMIGFYEIQIPQFIANRIFNIRGTGVISIFLMGLVAGFVAAPCTGPILASALIYIGTAGSPLLGGIYLFFYALGLSIIFIVAGSFSGALSKLPRSGRWMTIIRSIFAVAIISYSLYLLNTIYGLIERLNEKDIYHITGVILAIIGILGGGLTREVDFSPLRQKIIKLIMILSLSFSLLSFMITRQAEDTISWITDYETGKRKAMEENKPVIIDFYARWCAACNEIKNKTIPDPRIQEEAERFVMIMIDATDPDEKTLEIEKTYRVVGLPTIVFMDSELKEIEDFRITGFISADEFVRRMRSVK